jgi:bacteriocin-like protein
MSTLTIKDLPLTVLELEEKEMAHISGGMMNLGTHHPAPTDEGTTWVPEGTVKVYLGGVQIQ